jgi:ABC-2 type transport system permease protein
MTSPEIMERANRIAALPFVVVGGRSSFARGARSSLLDIWDHRELLAGLVRREIKSRYKDSSLGIVWSLFRPLAQLLIYYLAIGKVLGAARGTPDFAIFVFIGLTTWGLYAEIIQGSTTSVLNNAGLVKKVYLPREIFPLSTVGSAMFNALVQMVVLALAIVFLSSAPFRFGWTLLYAPLGIATVIVFAVAVGLVLSALNVYLRDTQHLVEIVMIVLFWASPIVYSYTYVHALLHGNWLEQVYLANPATIAILGVQKALWAAGSLNIGGIAQAWPPDLGLRLAITLLVSLALLLPAQRIFARLQGNFAQEL